MMNNNVSREKLMRQIQICSFAVYDALLYLDSHPYSKAALDYYNKYKRAEQNAMADYEARFGPLTLSAPQASWQWTNGPWPWQNEEVK